MIYFTWMVEFFYLFGVRIFLPVWRDNFFPVCWTKNLKQGKNYPFIQVKIFLHQTGKKNSTIQVKINHTIIEINKIAIMYFEVQVQPHRYWWKINLYGYNRGRFIGRFLCGSLGRFFIGDLWVQSPVIIIGNIRSIAENRRRSTEAYRRVMSTWPSMMVGTAEGDLPKLFSLNNGDLSPIFIQRHRLNYFNHARTQTRLK